MHTSEIQHLRHTLPHGITLNCRTAGQAGRPVLLFLHGFPEAAFVWDALMLHFAQPEHGGFRCVAPNLRGYAGSDAPADVSAYRPKHLVQDLTALITAETGAADIPLHGLIAHDWGGAVAWNLANQFPARIQRLTIINSPHPGLFLRELKHSPAQQAASAYMNFLIRPDAEALLAADDYRRLWAFFTNMGGEAWLSEAVKSQYREVWQQGLSGALNYYRASPLRPPTAADAGAAAVELPRSMLTVDVPTLVIWALQDAALPPALIDGLEDYVPRLTLKTVPDATHWIVHEKPALIAQLLAEHLLQKV
jgi:pimeloyl-ACP methyl ester carboxylesterase